MNPRCRFRHSSFRDCHLQPLGHLSKGLIRKFMASGNAFQNNGGEGGIISPHPWGSTLRAFSPSAQSSIFAVLQKLSNPCLTPANAFQNNGGEGGIRTLGTFLYIRFPVVPLRPLGHLSVKKPIQKQFLLKKPRTLGTLLSTISASTPYGPGTSP